MIQKSHIWNSFFENIISGIQSFYICPDVPVDIIRVFFNFRFSSRKFQGQQKLAKKTAHFTTQFCSKNVTHFTNLDSLDIENNMLPQTQLKTFLTLRIFSKRVSVLCQKKIFVLHLFLTLKNCILEAH